MHEKHLSTVPMFLVALMVKNLPGMWETQVQFLGSGKSPEGNGNSLQCSCLENPMDCPWNSPGQNTGMGGLSLLQIFPPRD